MSESTQLISVMKAFADTAPPPPDLTNAEPSDQARRPNGSWTLTLTAAAAVLVLAFVGFVALQGDDAATPSATSWGAWFDDASVDATEVYTFNPIWQAELGPAPQFDTSELGREIVLEPLTSSEPEWNWRSIFYGDLIDDTVREYEQVLVGGWLGETLVAAIRATAAVETIRDGSIPDRDTVVCPVFAHVENADGVGASHRCAADTENAEFGPRKFMRIGEGTYATQDAWSFVVPPDASLIAVDHDGELFWQQPRGGMGLFLGDFSAGSITYTVYASDGSVLLQGNNRF